MKNIYYKFFLSILIVLSVTFIGINIKGKNYHDYTLVNYKDEQSKYTDCTLSNYDITLLSVGDGKHE